MTVAAVILATAVESALADAAGVPRVRLIADAAWSGGALPIVVVAPDPDGTVAAALAGAPVTLAAPVAAEAGSVGQIVRGVEVAAGEIGETSAALIWPERMCWVGPETVTSLIEAHGTDLGTLLRPGYRGDAGWPVLVPLGAVAALRTLSSASLPDELLDALVASGTVTSRTIDLGDPGTVIDGATRREDLPAYEGPAEPLAAHAHEWGAAVAAMPDDAPA